jgi:integrase
MVKLTPMHLLSFYKNLSEITSEKTGRPLSQRTISHYHRCIGAILAQATRERVIPRNIASREFMKAPEVKEKELAHLNDEQAQRFVNLLLIEEDIRIKAVLLLMLYSGCRIGEITGLEWSDCDFTKQTIQVKRSSQYVKGRGLITKEPKNKTSKRTIKLPQIIMSILSEYKIWYDEQRDIHGDRWHESNRLFIQSDGKPIQPGTINKWMDNFVKQHDFPHVTPHSLRHTNISLLIASGVDLRTVSAKAGHSRTSTTMDIYAYEIQAANELSTDVLDEILTPKKTIAVSY